MKEGLVLDINKDCVVVLSKNGEFLKLQKSGVPAIGEVYRAREYKRFKPSMFYAAAALIAFMITSFAGYTAYANQIVGVIDITGDKTVKLYFNRAGNVQKVEGIENSNSYKKLPLENAIKKLTDGENSELKFTDLAKINASATKLKESKVDINKININLQKILEDKKVKIENLNKKEDKEEVKKVDKKEDKKEDKKDSKGKNNNSSSGSGKDNNGSNKNNGSNGNKVNNGNNGNNNSNENNRNKGDGNNDDNNQGNNNDTKRNNNVSYLFELSDYNAKVSCSRSSSSLHREYNKYIEQVSKNAKKINSNKKNCFKKFK